MYIYLIPGSLLWGVYDADDRLLCTCNKLADAERLVAELKGE